MTFVPHSSGSQIMHCFQVTHLLSTNRSVVNRTDVFSPQTKVKDDSKIGLLISSFHIRLQRFGLIDTIG